MFSQELAREDWRFDSVPEEELNACCVWEYGRESQFLRSIRERSAEAFRLKFSFEKRLDFVDRDFSTVHHALGRSAMFFQEGIYGLGGDKPHPGVVSRFPEPWQSLSKSERLILLETANWDSVKTAGFPGFRRSNFARAQVLVNLFEPKGFQEVFGVESMEVAKYFHAGHKLRSICPNLMFSLGTEILLVEIEWGSYTNEQLVKEFAQWLKENNPPGILRPDKRGHKKISDRVKLERLGIMRLLNKLTLTELKNHFAAAWKHYQSPNRRWRREASMAATHFRELFPFLRQNDTPLAWPPKGAKQNVI